MEIQVLMPTSHKLQLTVRCQCQATHPNTHWDGRALGDKDQAPTSQAGGEAELQDQLV